MNLSITSSLDLTDSRFIKSNDNVGYYHGIRYSSMQGLNARNKMHGVKRVITFCLLIVVLPATLIIIPLYLRHSVFADVVLAVAESDILEIRDGISSIFCQRHSLRMNSSFNAFQLRSRPEISTNRKHIRLKKSMTLPDDTLEYWGFYLLKGAIVELKVCSRYDGSRILVVKGDRNLRTCGLLEHNKNKVGTHFAQGHDKVQVTFETAAEVVISDEAGHQKHRYKSNGPNDSDDTGSNEEDFDNHGGEETDDDDNQKLPPSVKNKPNKLDTPGKTSYHSPDKVISDKKTEHVLSINLGKQQFNETDINSNAASINPNRSTISDVKEGVKKMRHRRHHIKKQNQEKHHFEQSIHKKKHRKHKRDLVYDRKISHGGNALNFTDQDSNSISSFENSLLTCYNGQILLAQGFPPSSQCLSVRYLDSGTHMVSRHEVVEDGYYYYIFYSDNDLVRNDIHSIFDIYKPTFEYANLTDANSCLNRTNCSFDIDISSDEMVIVEVPTRDGIEHDEDDITYLISTCHPRMSVYVIFPISVLLLILSCAFI